MPKLLTRKRTRKRTRTRYSKLRDISLVVIGICLTSYASLQLWDWYNNTQGSVPPPDPTQVITVSNTTPEERPVDTTALYAVAPNEPKRLTIETLGIVGLVQKVGKDPANIIASPANVHMAGWYTGSVLPGTKGLSIIDGHVSGRYGPALFQKLKDVRLGDAIMIEYGDGSTKRFEVISKNKLTKAEAGAFLMEKDPSIEQQLNLTTCAGVFSTDQGEYDDRLVVVSKLIAN